MSDEKINLQDLAKKNREEKAKAREDELRKITKEDNVLGLAAQMNESNQRALKALDTAISVIEVHISEIKRVKKTERDNFTRAMFVFDDYMDDYSSDEWDRDQEIHQENLEALTGLRDAMKEEAHGDDRTDDSPNSPGSIDDGSPDNGGEEPTED